MNSTQRARWPVTVVIGTRPEGVKLAPVVLALKSDERFDCLVCSTGQHRQMLDQIFEVFGIRPDTDLALMQAGQTLAGLSARAIEALDGCLARTAPRLVLVQGDTTTVLCAALAAFYRKVPIAHIEAGLRTGNLQAPWPEEANRVLVTRLTDLHFAPTDGARRNLLQEGVPAQRIHMTGNTVIDALRVALEQARISPPVIHGLPGFLQPVGRSISEAGIRAAEQPAPRLVLITGHRRENFGDGFESICRAIATLARRFPDVHFVYPVHLNPNVREPVQRILSVAKAPIQEPGLPNIHLIEPLPYLSFVALMDRATLILTDSGGVQEEAPSLGKPVLVMRDATERPEAVEAGTVQLVGTDFDRIVSSVSHLLTSPEAYDRMSRAHNPYGDGKATGRIVAACAAFLAEADQRLAPTTGSLAPESDDRCVVSSS